LGLLLFPGGGGGGVIGITQVQTYKVLLSTSGISLIKVSPFVCPGAGVLHSQHALSGISALSGRQISSGAEFSPLGQGAFTHYAPVQGHLSQEDLAQYLSPR